MPPSPLSSAPATASASTAPVGSLNADSAITVCATRRRSREATNSGIRIAGSVGESTAPISRPCSNGSPNASDATAPVSSAVRITPGIASSPRLTATSRSTRERQVQPAVEQDRRDAEREQELRAERVERHVDDVERRRPERRADRDQQHDLRQAHDVGQHARREAGGQQQAEGEDDVARQAASRSSRRSSARRTTSCTVMSSSTITTPAPIATATSSRRALSRAASNSCGRRRGLAPLLGGERLRGARHRREVLELGAEQDPLRLGRVAGLQRGPRVARRAP